MTKNIFFAIILLAFSLTGYAQEFTKIEGANIKCAQPGGAISINTTSKRLWQNDTIEEETGLELIVKKFAAASCQNCFTIIGNFNGMGPEQLIVYSVKKSTLSVSFKEAGTSTPVAKMSCTVE